MIRKVLIVTILSAAALIAGALVAQAGGGHGCVKLTEAHTTEISVRHNCFDAGIAYVEVGDKVTWTNHDDWAHNIAAATFGSAHSLDTPHTWTFLQEGIYPYTCTLHWGMVGAVVVGDVDPTTVATIAAAPIPTEPASSGDLPIAAAMGAGLAAVVLGVRSFTRRVDAD